jgi:hypothetical protein
MEMKVSESVTDNSVGRSVAIPPIGNTWGSNFEEMDSFFSGRLVV